MKKYESAAEQFKSWKAQPNGQKDLKFGDLPWPVLNVSKNPIQPSDVTMAAVDAFLESVRKNYQYEKGMALCKQIFAQIHPDKAGGLLNHIMSTEDKKNVREGMAIVTPVILGRWNYWKKYSWQY